MADDDGGAQTRRVQQGRTRALSASV